MPGRCLMGEPEPAGHGVARRQIDLGDERLAVEHAFRTIDRGLARSWGPTERGQGPEAILVPPVRPGQGGGNRSRNPVLLGGRLVSSPERR